MEKSQIYIIGGGAAGFFAAANLDGEKFRICILEQGADVLQKVKISGGGRCNVSHACFDARELAAFYPRGNRELLSVFSKFQPGDTMDWFESRGVPLKIEADSRIFPESNSSQSIIDALLEQVQGKAELKTKTSVKEISPSGGRYRISANSGDFLADYVIFCTGSSPKSLKILENLGHKVVPQVPSLFTFNITDGLLQGLAGTSFANTEIAIPALKAHEGGSLLITHWGLSGPAVLRLSAWKARELAEKSYQFEITVNFISKTMAEAEEEFHLFRNQNPKKSVGQSKIFDVTNRFWLKLLEVSKVDSAKAIANLNKQEVAAILENLCRKTFSVSGKSTFKDEFVTAGGVDLKEINFKNMRSRLLPNFYIAGEVLDIDAVTGGFNFQACWSEAWLIAQDLNSI